jgi:dihydroflavonol-4-reductase
LTRRPPVIRANDPPIDWIIGDLRNSSDRRRSLEAMRGVIHVASWVSLGSDPRGEGIAINVEATRGLLADAIFAGVERFVSTSTLHTLAAGSAEVPADELTPWNLKRVDSPYARSKREAESIVLDGLGGKLPGVVLCPGMIVGARDPKPTSTSLLLVMARSPVAFLPRGGIPLIDAEVASLAHRRALVLGQPGSRYALVGPYVSYAALAQLVSRVAGWPRAVVPLPDWLEFPLTRLAGAFDRLAGGRFLEISSAAIAGGFLKLHVSGSLADATFHLVHPDPLHSVGEALRDYWTARSQGDVEKATTLGSLGNSSSSLRSEVTSS